MKQFVCPYCDYPIDDTDVSCPNCGEYFGIISDLDEEEGYEEDQDDNIIN